MLGAAFAALIVSGPIAAHAQPPGWAGPRGGPQGPGPSDHDDRGRLELVGPGVPDLLPPLRDTRRGAAFVLRNFDFNRDGVIDRREAHAANEAFLRMGGPDRQGFDEDRGPGYGPPPPPLPPAYDAPGDFDRPAMREYHFHQGRYGAMFTLPDVLFETAKSNLRPGVDAKLRPLADFLRRRPRVRLRIDGYTDSVGSAAYNQMLSQDRARAVGEALAMMGIDPGRFELAGHGKDMPVATNATAKGRQLNRRVEVTLVGQRAATFD
jgi:outer membrane protein OmpA-like peptidoglycan-associated protein